MTPGDVSHSLAGHGGWNVIRQSVLHRPADLTALKEKHDSEAEEEEVMEEEQEGEEEEREVLIHSFT